MIVAKFSIEFGEHVPKASRSSMTSGMAAYGNVTAQSSGRQLIVEVFRKSKVERFRSLLRNWERLGSLRWIEQISN